MKVSLIEFEVIPSFLRGSISKTSDVKSLTTQHYFKSTLLIHPGTDEGKQLVLTRRLILYCGGNASMVSNHGFMLRYNSSEETSCTSVVKPGENLSETILQFQVDTGENTANNITISAQLRRDV